MQEIDDDSFAVLGEQNTLFMGKIVFWFFTPKQIQLCQQLTKYFANIPGAEMEGPLLSHTKIFNHIY